MSTFVVHSIPGSPFGRAVLVTLIEKQADYRLAPVSPAALRSPENLARHPFGRVPSLEHGEFRMFETQAILRYLDRVLPAPPLTPSDPRAAARMDQLMNINDWYLFQGVSSAIVFQRIVGPRLLGLVPDEAAIAAALPKAKVVIDVLGQQLADRPFFTGSALSLADILLAPQLDMFSETPEWKLLAANQPKLVGWLERMTTRNSMRATTWDTVAAQR